MHAQIHDTDRHPDGHPGYLVKIAAAMEENERAYREAAKMPCGTDAEQAVRAARLALISARAGAWWGLLTKAIARDPRMHSLYLRVYLRAAAMAEASEKSRARFWRDAAADWRARAERRPTSDAAGGMSNWQQLGVTP
jgi:hypothetical protein